MGRILLLLFVALGLAPGTWLRSTGREVEDLRPQLFFDRLDAPRTTPGGGLEVAGAWHVRSPHAHFYGYSALMAVGDGTLLAVTDHRRQVRFAPPGAARPWVKFDTFAAPDPGDGRPNDVEAITRDRVSGTMWAAYERANLIERYEADLPIDEVRPPAMRNWPNNRGPEAMLRLTDGRFVVLSEGSPDWFVDDLPALVFAGDPVGGAEPQAFRFRPPEGFAPVDMAQLPDGQVLILLRALRWGLPPTFEGKLVVADPATIRPGERWAWREIAQLTQPLPTDNYEGLAVEPRPDGSAVLWLISDDNLSRLQRTLLLKLVWRPNEKARGTRRAPS